MRNIWLRPRARAPRRAIGALMLLTTFPPAALAADPNPLQSAYWRFEEGTAGEVVPANMEVVLDSINDNDMRAFLSGDGAIDARPTYVTMVPPTPLKSGLPNTLALDFVRNPNGGGDDLFALNQEINNGIIAAGAGFTVEAAFNTNNPVLWAAVVSKEGQPGGSRPLQTFAVKTRGDDGRLLVEQWDENANLVQVNSLAPIVANQWYYAAVVNDGSNLSLYLDSNDGAGYQLQESVAVSGALYQANPARPNWDGNWTIGRGEFGGFPADWFDGIIDEVRLTNMALPPSQFLFVPPGEDLAGDFSGNGTVENADLTLLLDNWGSPVPPVPAGWVGAQPTSPAIDNDELTALLDNWGASQAAAASLAGAAAVPEPTSLALCLLAFAACAVRRRRSVVRLASGLQLEGLAMNARGGSLRVGTALFAFALGSWSTAMADVPPNPLESAYWRFEEGTAFSQVPANTDVVVDSINNNDMRAFVSGDGAIDARPTYVSSVPPNPLQSGSANTLALDFIPNAGGGGDDLFTLFNDDPDAGAVAKNINNGFLEPGGGFTLEAAFNTNNPIRWAAVVGKDGRPGGTNHPVQTLVLKTRGDNGHLFFEQWDEQSNLVGVNSLAPIVAGQWYYAAVVNDGSTLSLYLDSNDGSGYQLQESVAVSGALFKGNPANPLWDASWTIGRGQFGGNPADWWDGIIDEVRLTNSALAPSGFLFAPGGGAAGAAAPEPASLFMLLLAICACSLKRMRR